MYAQTEIHLNLAKIRRPAPSYLSCLVPPAARGVNADLRRFTNVRAPVSVKIRRLRKAFSGVKLFHQIAGLVIVKYGRRSRVEI